MHGLGLTTVKIANVYDKNALKNVLLQLVENDYDYNGENGLKYVSDEAKAKGYESEAEYSADFFIKEFLSDDKYKDYEDDKRIKLTIENYIDDWFRSDTSYYALHDYTITFIGERGCVISVAYYYEC